MWRSVAHACDRGDFRLVHRLVHCTLQGNHAHLIVEAAHRPALAPGMKAVGARLARAVNRVFGRSGPVLADRYHMRALKTPREVRNAIRYVLLNARRHARSLKGAGRVQRLARGERGGAGGRHRRRRTAGGAGAVMAPQSRLATHGLLDPADAPGPG